MCLQVKEVKVLKEPMTVYKVVEKKRNNAYYSLFMESKIIPNQFGEDGSYQHDNIKPLKNSIFKDLIYDNKTTKMKEVKLLSSGAFHYFANLEDAKEVKFRCASSEFRPGLIILECIIDKNMPVAIGISEYVDDPFSCRVVGSYNSICSRQFKEIKEIC